MGKIIRLFGVDINVSINDEEEETRKMEMELGRRLKSFIFTKNWVRVYNPTPLRSCPPPKINKKIKKKKMLERKKREDDMVATEEEEPPAVIPSGLLQLIEGTATEAPVFLYQKRLTISDLEKRDNRLFVTTKGRERFNEFLREEEREIVNDPTTKGLRNILGIDAQGQAYNLGLNFWPSIKILVIKSDWIKLADQNTAREGDWVQIWGYRGDQLQAPCCLAINFINNKKPNHS